MCLKSNCDTNHFLFFLGYVASCDMVFLNRFQDYLMKYILHNKFVIMIYSVVVYDGVPMEAPVVGCVETEMLIQRLTL